MMSWDERTAKYNGPAPKIYGPTFGHLVHFKHDIVSFAMAKSIHEIAGGCAKDHLVARNLINVRNLRIITDIPTNTLSIVYGVLAPGERSILFTINQFSGPLSLIAAKTDADREAFVCGEIEKLISKGEGVIAQEFSL
jgi:hypothetical protein